MPAALSLPMAVSERDGEQLLRELKDTIPEAAMIGYVTEREDCAVAVEE